MELSQHAGWGINNVTETEKCENLILNAQEREKTNKTEKKRKTLLEYELNILTHDLQAH